MPAHFKPLQAGTELRLALVFRLCGAKTANLKAEDVFGVQAEARSLLVKA
jgi:hypothetical protein